MLSAAMLIPMGVVAEESQINPLNELYNVAVSYGKQTHQKDGKGIAYSLENIKECPNCMLISEKRTEKGENFVISDGKILYVDFKKDGYLDLALPISKKFKAQLPKTNKEAQTNYRSAIDSLVKKVQYLSE